jgi:hypothetical protein
MRNKKIQNLEIPEDYFQLSNIDKETICMVIMNNILDVIDSNYSSKYDKKEIMNKILDISIQSNINEEIYEVAQVLYDVKKLLNE